MISQSKSWWPSLHDGYLERFETSANEHTATLKVRISHLGDESGHGSHFEMRLTTVQAVHVDAWESRGDRTVSIEADDFVDSGLRIVDAVVQDTQAGDLIWPRVNAKPDTRVKLLTLDIDGSESTGIGDRGVAIVFSEVEILREGSAISPDDFIALGESYWQRFRDGAEQ